jgi:hypothetical protein
MKKIILTLALLVFAVASFAQKITEEQFKELVRLLDKEDWKTVYQNSGQLLKNAKDDDELKPMVTYMHLLSAAGSVTIDQMSFSELKKIVAKFNGQKILMAAHTIAKSENDTMNKTLIEQTPKGSTGFTTATNSKGVNILCFEHFSFKEKVEAKDFENAFAMCGGVIESIEVHDSPMKIWILKIKVKDAFANKLN